LHTATAAQERYPFSNEVDRTRFQSQIYQIRCLVCQGQSIGDSDSYFAQNMRDWLYDAISDGYTDYEIRQQLLEKFGEQIFYVPSFGINTIMLWGLPALFLLLGLLFYWRRGRHAASHPA
jgi:cytochrome c-type biogenesis protein CcmH